MSITRTMQTGASGLRAHGEALGVVGDNIANVNTVGFKGQRAGFQDVLGRSIAGSASLPAQAGAGSAMSHIEQMWTQGALLTTDTPTDLAIAGNGFFVVSGNVGGTHGSILHPGWSVSGRRQRDADRPEWASASGVLDSA